LTNKTALITGGSRGLGLLIAEAFGELGAKVAITARKQGEAEKPHPQPGQDRPQHRVRGRHDEQDEQHEDQHGVAAPPAVVDRNRARLAELRADIERLTPAH